MTKSMQLLITKLQFSVHGKVFERMAHILAAGSPCPIRTSKPQHGGAFRVTFYNPSHFMGTFASVELNALIPGYKMRWRQTMPVDLWAVSKDQLEFWLKERLDTSIPEDLFGQSRLTQEFHAGFDYKAEEANVAPLEALQKYRRVRQNPIHYGVLERFA